MFDDDTLDIGRSMGRNPDLQGECRFQPATGTSHRAGRTVAFEHVVAGDQVDRLAFRRVSRRCDQAAEITPGERVHLAVGLRERLGEFGLVGTGEAEQGRQQVDMAGRCALDRCSDGRLGPDPSDLERHSDGLVVELVPLLVQSAVRAEEVAVIGAEHEHGIVGVVGDGFADPIDRAVDVVMEAVVKLPVLGRVSLIRALDKSGDRVTRVVRVSVGAVERRLAREILVVGGRRRDRRRRGDRRRVGLALPHEAREQHDVVRVDEAAHEEERLQRFLIAGCAAGVPVLEPCDGAVGVQRVADVARIGDIGAVGLGPDPAAEAELAERIGIEVRLHGLGEDVAITRVGRHRLAVLHEVGVADMPFAVVVGVVASGPEPVADRGDLTRAQPPHAGVVVEFAETVGLGDAVHFGVLAGEQRRATRNTRGRGDIVPLEAHTVVGEPGTGGQVLVAPGPNLVVLVARSGTLFVGEDDDQVGTAHELSFSERATRSLTSDELVRPISRAAALAASFIGGRGPGSMLAVSSIEVPAPWAASTHRFCTLRSALGRPRIS